MNPNFSHMYFRCPIGLLPAPLLLRPSSGLRHSAGATSRTLCDLVGLRCGKPLLRLWAGLFADAAVSFRVASAHLVGVGVIVLAAVPQVQGEFCLGATDLHVGFSLVLHEHARKAHARPPHVPPRWRRA